MIGGRGAQRPGGQLAAVAVDGDDGVGALVRVDAQDDQGRISFVQAGGARIGRRAFPSRGAMPRSSQATPADPEGPGRWNEELQTRAEAVVWRARLARLRPDDANARRAYTHVRDNLAKHFSERGLSVYEAQIAEEAADRLLPPDPPTLRPHHHPSSTTPAPPSLYMHVAGRVEQIQNTEHRI